MGNILGIMQREEAIELIRNSPLAEYGDMLVDYLLPSARIIVSDETEGSGRLSASYFGASHLYPRTRLGPNGIRVTT
jgi:hypothetical protein